MREQSSLMFDPDLEINNAVELAVDHFFQR